MIVKTYYCLVAAVYFLARVQCSLSASMEQNRTAGPGVESISRTLRQNQVAHSLLLCANPRLTSPCISILWDDLACMELPLEWDDVVTSVALKGSRQLCILYRDYGCNGPTFEARGYIPELQNFEYQVSSFRCLSE